LLGSALGTPLTVYAQDDALAQANGEPMELAAISYMGNAELPPALGQASFAVYLPETGHTLSDVFLDYWRATGEEAMFGLPISEPFATEDGTYAQIFERGALEYLPLKVWTVEPFVRPMPVGRLLIGERSSGLGAPGSGKRLASGNRAPEMRFLAADDPVVQEVLANGGFYDSASGHTISGAFLDWYWAHEGDYYLGSPLSEIVEVDGHTAQWFDGGLLIETADGVQLAPLGEQLAERFEVSTAPMPDGDLPVYAESLFTTVPNPAPVAETDGHGPKRIEVSIDQQMLRAFEGSTLVLETAVSTGLAPNDTERGRFRIRYKVAREDMRGATDSEGNVIWVVGDGGDPPAGSIPYGVSDVPNVMYINMDAEALHGAYWHSNFGNVMSHGCINLPLPVAEFLYGWAPIGTPVTVS
jgi:lipoprotein-anchoring transpeptidase ErfK/SrfK